MTSALRNMFTLLTQPRHKDLPVSARAEVFGDVLNMASRAPANFLNLDGYGQLQVGNRADFVLLDESIFTKACWIGGKQVFGAQQEGPG